MSVHHSPRVALRLSTLTAGLLLLAACSSFPGFEGSGLGGQESGSAPPPGSVDSGAQTGQALPPPGASGEAGSALPPTASEGLPSQQAAAPAEGQETVIVKGPDGTNWAVGSSQDEEAYRADIEDCYAYATAQTRRDAQITDDRNAGIDTLTSGSRYSALRQRVDEFDLRQRRGSLMTGCMEAKGYVRTDTVLPRLEF
ncbi:MAG TPA: hypothetical protein EYH07_08865 [Kiloniellaceae bacterium]|nr:hypothetical protein [Kiloniellaceae bacterium]